MWHNGDDLSGIGKRRSGELKGSILVNAIGVPVTNSIAQVCNRSEQSGSLLAASPLYVIARAVVGCSSLTNNVTWCPMYTSGNNSALSF